MCTELLHSWADTVHSGRLTGNQFASLYSLFGPEGNRLGNNDGDRRGDRSCLQIQQADDREAVTVGLSTILSPIFWYCC